MKGNISRHITTYRQHRRETWEVVPVVRGSIVPTTQHTSFGVAGRDLFSIQRIKKWESHEDHKKDMITDR